MKGKRAYALLVLAALLAFFAAACTAARGEDGPVEETPEKEVVSDGSAEETPELLSASDAMRGMTAEKILYTEKWQNVDRAALADALREAAGHPADVELPFTEWRVDAYLELNEEGSWSSALRHFELSCGQTENIVLVRLRDAEQSDSLFVQDEALYWIVRRSCDQTGGVEQEAYERFKDLLAPRTEATLANHSDSPMEPTGYEVTLFTKYLTYEDAQSGARVDVYDFDFAMPLRHPECSYALTGGWRLDSQLRMTNSYLLGGNLVVCFRNGEQIGTAVKDSDMSYRAVYMDEPDYAAEAEAWAAEQLKSMLR